MVAVVVLFDRFWRDFHREQRDETTDATGSSPSPRAAGEVIPSNGPKDCPEPDPHSTGNV